MMTDDIKAAQVRLGDILNHLDHLAVKLRGADLLIVRRAQEEIHTLRGEVEMFKRMATDNARVAMRKEEEKV